MTAASSSIFRLRKGLWAYLPDSEEDMMGGLYCFRSLFAGHMYSSTIVPSVAEFEPKGVIFPSLDRPAPCLYQIAVERGSQGGVFGIGIGTHQVLSCP